MEPKIKENTEYSWSRSWNPKSIVSLIFHRKYGGLTVNYTKKVVKCFFSFDYAIMRDIVYSPKYSGSVTVWESRKSNSL